jgi:drug/metabolite transporter (DMT)-like permease
VVYLAMVLHSVISAGTYLAAKRVLGEISWQELALVRFTLAGLVYGGLLLAKGRRVERKDWPTLFLLGLVAVPLNQGFFLGGLARSTPGHAALLYALTPVFVFLLARLRLGERAGPLELAGMALAFGGVVLVLLAKGQLSAPAAAEELQGDLLILVGVLAWAIYAVAGKPLAVKYGALTTTGLSLVIGAALYLPAGIAWSRPDAIRAMSAGGWEAIAYLVLVTSVVSYLIYYWALARIEATKVAVFSNLQPVLTAALSYGLGQESLSGAFVAGGALVLAGVFLTERG